MIEGDIQKLDREAGRRSLDGLEAAIWQGVEARAQARRALRTVVSCQVAVLAVAVLSSVAAGTTIAMNVPARSIPTVLSVATELSPSARLIGY